MKTSRKINWYIGLTTKGGAILKEVETIERVVKFLKLRGVDCFSTSINTGFWEGKREQTLVITLIDSGCDFGERSIEEIASQFAKEFNQDCVLCTIEEIKYNFVS